MTNSTFLICKIIFYRLANIDNWLCIFLWWDKRDTEPIRYYRTFGTLHAIGFCVTAVTVIFWDFVIVLLPMDLLLKRHCVISCCWIMVLWVLDCWTCSVSKVLIPWNWWSCIFVSEHNIKWYISEGRACTKIGNIWYIPSVCESLDAHIRIWVTWICCYICPSISIWTDKTLPRICFCFTTISRDRCFYCNRIIVFRVCQFQDYRNLWSALSWIPELRLTVW